MGLDFDLGTMQLDDRGIWIDHGVPYKSFLPPDFCDTGDTVPVPAGLNGREPIISPPPAVDGPAMEALPNPSGYPRDAVFGPPAVNLKES
jgi:hypothetical protein